MTYHSTVQRVEYSQNIIITLTDGTVIKAQNSYAVSGDAVYEEGGDLYIERFGKYTLLKGKGEW